MAVSLTVLAVMTLIITTNAWVSATDISYDVEGFLNSTITINSAFLIAFAFMGVQVIPHISDPQRRARLFLLFLIALGYFFALMVMNALGGLGLIPIGGVTQTGRAFYLGITIGFWFVGTTVLCVGLYSAFSQNGRTNFD